MQARPWAGRVTALAAVLALGGIGGVGVPAAAAATLAVVCPDVASRVTDVPDAARAEVDRELANLVQQIDEVEDRLAREPDQADSQLGVLKERRVSTIDRIVIAITRAGGSEPAGIRELAPCELREAGDGGGGGGAGGGGRDEPAPEPTTPPPTRAPEERPTPAPSPTPDPPTCEEVAHRLAGAADDARAALILRLAGQDALAACVDPRGADAPPPEAGPATGSGGTGAGEPRPAWPPSLVAANGQGEGLGLDPVIGTSILILLLAGITFMLIRADVVRLSRSWGAQADAPHDPDLT